MNNVLKLTETSLKPPKPRKTSPLKKLNQFEQAKQSEVKKTEWEFFWKKW